MSGFRVLRIAIVFWLSTVAFASVFAITQIADPVLSASAGTSSSTVTVTATDSITGATLYYTTNGANPTTSSSSITTGQTVVLAQGSTLKIQAYQGYNNPSNVISGAYTASGFISSSTGHTVALKNDGTAWAFGGNSSGQLGIGNNSPASLPTPITQDATHAAFTGVVPFFDQISSTVQYENGLPIPFEILYFGATGQNPNALSTAGDGYTLLQEAQLGRNPNDYYQGVVPQIAIINGSGQTGPAGAFLPQPLIVKVSNSARIGATNAPVTFTVTGGGGGISLINSGGTGSTLSVRTDSSGQAEIYFQLPTTPSGTNTITATAGTASPVTFTENASPGSAPGVSLAVSPTSANSPATPTLTATITSGTANQVVFYEGQQILGTVTGTSSQFALPALQNVTAGVHSYTAIATNTTTGATGQGSVTFRGTVPGLPFAQYRYTRVGGGSDPSFQTFVVALNQTSGVLLDIMGNNSSHFPNGQPWFTQIANTTAYSISVSSTAGAQRAIYTQAFQNPVVAFGASTGGTPLYTGQSYSFGFGCGGQDPSMTTIPDLRIRVYSASAFPGTGVAPVATFTFTLPRQGTADWTTFAQNGFLRNYTLSQSGTTFPLTTTFRYQPSGTNTPDGNSAYSFGSGQNSPFILTHTDTSTGIPAYYYEIDYEGVTVENATGGTAIEQWMAQPSPNLIPNSIVASNSTLSSAAYSLGYTLDFTSRPVQQSTFISQSSFQGQPLPAAYANMSVPELLNASTPVTSQLPGVTPTSTFTIVDNSPELRQHPVLDKLATDLTGTAGSNTSAIAMAMANYVLNNIQLTDALSFDRNGNLADVSINCGGVNRGAMATYMEKQGNPTEQCALLIYLLRKTGIPCGYVFPANDTLQMLDERMSSILRMQLHNAVDPFGNPIMPQIIPVNYPWVAAYVGGTNSGGTYSGGTWIHIFPWMKDTSITEGYDLNPLMPGPGSGSPTPSSTGYQSGFAWMQNYLLRDSNILSLSSQWDDPAHLFVPFISAQLAAYHPTISINNVGIQAFDRQNTYTSWSQFPQPWGLTGTLSSSNFQPTLAQLDATDAALSPAVGSIFNTISLSVLTYGNGGSAGSAIFSPNPVTLKAVDLHNRRLMVHEVQNGTGSTYTMTFSLAPFRPGTTGTGNFSGSPVDIVNKQVLTNASVPQGDLVFSIQATYNRNLNMPNGFVPPTSQWTQFLGAYDNDTWNTGYNYFYSGDLITYCLDYGRATQPMLDLHAQNYWAAQQAVMSGSGSGVDPDDLIGEPLYLMGLSYYKATDDFQAQVQALYKSNIISHLEHGTTKIGAVRTSGGILPSGTITLSYPSFDVSDDKIAVAGYFSAHADTATAPYSQDALYVRNIGGSANEHTIINNFFHLTDSASSVHVMDVSQLNGKPIVFLTSQNYTTQENNTYTASANINGTISTQTQTLSTWAGTEWSPLVSSFQKSPYAFAYLTPGNVTCANGQYLGMGFVTGDGFGDVSTLLNGNQFQLPLNGGIGGALPSPYVITNTTSGASSPGNWQLTFNNGLYNFLNQSISTSNQYFFTGSVATSNLSTIDSNISAGTWLESTYDINFNHAANIALGNATLSSTAPTTAGGQATEAKAVQSQGYLATSYHAENSFGKIVMDPVDVVEGGFHVDDTDLSMPGPLPIRLQRHYYSLNQGDGDFGFGWMSNYVPYLVVSSSSPPVISAAEADGSVIAYTQKLGSTTTWIPMAANNPSLVNQHGNQSGGLSNLFNNVLVVSGSTYTLTGADGSVRTYVMSSSTQYAIGTGATAVSRQRPYLTTWKDPQGNTLTFTIGSSSTSNDYGKLSRIASSNGNYIQLDYDNFGHVLTAVANDGRDCSYTYDTFGDLTSVTRADGSVVNYAYDHQTQTVNSVAQPYSDHLLTQENQPNGHQLVNIYNAFPDRRVNIQKATVGTNNTLATNATFTYTNSINGDGTLTGSTTVADAYSRVSTYKYSESEITEIDDPSPLTTKISQSWYPTTTGTGAYNRSLQQRVDKRGLTQNFFYDGSGNLKETDTAGNLTGSGTETLTLTATFNSQNLPTLITDTSTGNSTAFGYTSGISSYLCTSITNSTPQGQISQTTYSYGNITGTSFANGMLQQVIVANGSSDQAETDFIYNQQGYPTSETIHSGTNDPNVTYSFSYDPSGQLAKKTDSAGRFTQLGYDALGNVIAQENYDQSGNLVGWHYNYFDQNGQLQWTEGPRINPDDYTYRTYDGGGRLTQVLQYRSQAKSDGSGVQQATGNNFIGTTSYQYDLFGDQTLQMDPNGNTVQMGYDSIGRLTSRTYFDSGSNQLATEGFTYDTNNSGDKVATYTNPLGGVTQYFYTHTGQLTKQINPDLSTQQWFYQTDGRLHQVVYRNGSKSTLAYDDLNRVVKSTITDGSGNFLTTESQSYDRRGNPISKTDAAGYVTSTTFDGLDRVKSITGPPAANGSAQQQVTYTYDAAGISDTATNASGESTVTSYDALYRPVQITINSAAGTTIRQKGFSYSPDHQSVTSFDGTNTNVTTTYTDIQGSPVLVKKVDSFTLSQYDPNENLTNAIDELSRTTNYTYDGLNRVTQQKLPDGATTNFTYDLTNRVLTRAMPNSLTWSGTFDTSSREVSEELVQGGNTTRTYNYQYYSSGELYQVTDPRSIVSTYTYDGFDRVKSLTAIDPSFGQVGVTQNYQYDNRGLLTELDQSYQDSTLSPLTSVVRSYDGYGAILTEQVYLNGSLKDTWQEQHDAAGRRSQLTEFNYSTKPFTYQYQADGSLTQTSFNGSNYQYGYGLDGLLNLRVTPFNTQAVFTRDFLGRVREQKQIVGSTIYLDEVLSPWRGDSTQTAYAATRSGSGAWNETRNYTYDDTTGQQRGHLLTETFAPSSGTSSTLTYQFDGGTAGGLGQRTSAALTSGSLTGTNSSTFGAFARLSQQNLSGSLFPASGSPVNDANYDASGQLTNHNPGSNTDTLTWDALGRLVTMQRNPFGSGFIWSAVYDGFGRRLQTTNQPTTSGVNTGSPLVAQSSYDPDVQFLELAVTVGTQREWLVHGPDVDGGYGDLQGTGGVEAVVNDSTSATTGVFSDVYGHAVATVSGSTVTWNPVRSSGYGPQPGTTAQPLDGVHDLSTMLAWRGKYVDSTGFYYLGNRYYDPSSGTFLSADPLGHAASMDLYSYCGGDPINSFDPDGRLATKYGQNTLGRAEGARNFALDTVESVPTILYEGSVLSVPEHLEVGGELIQDPVGFYQTRWQNLSQSVSAKATQAYNVYQSGPEGRGRVEGYAGLSIASWFIGLGEERTIAEAEQVTGGMSTLQRIRAVRASSGGAVLNPFAANNRPAWFQRVIAGNQFNEIRRKLYTYNEIYLVKNNGYTILDSYNPILGEIVSRKFTQFSDIQEQTGIGYVNELASKYRAGSTIASVPSSGILAGEKLSGNLILEVPPQINPIPQSVLDAAEQTGVLIRDTNGKVY